MDEEIIVGSRQQVAVATLGALAFVALGVWLVSIGLERSAKAVILGAAAIVFFGACAVLGVASILRPNRLVLTAQDFVLERPLRRTRRIAWVDVEQIYILSEFLMRSVAYRLRPDCAPTGWMGAAKCALPTGWQIGTDAVLARMLEWKNAPLRRPS